jgi:hypothetical protein
MFTPKGLSVNCRVLVNLFPKLFRRGKHDGPEDSQSSGFGNGRYHLAVAIQAMPPE